MAEWNTRVLDFMERKPVRWVLIGAPTVAVMSFVIWRYPPVPTLRYAWAPRGWRQNPRFNEPAAWP